MIVGITIVGIVFLLYRSVKVVPEQRAYIVELFGRYSRTLKPENAPQIIHKGPKWKFYNKSRTSINSHTHPKTGYKMEILNINCIIIHVPQLIHTYPLK